MICRSVAPLAPARDPHLADSIPQISVTSLYTIAGWALPKLEEMAKDPNARPSFLVTSGGLAKDPYPHVFSLAMCKAAQYNFVWSLWKKNRGLGVHCGLLVVQG